MLIFRKARPEDNFHTLIEKGNIGTGRRDLVVLAFKDEGLIGVCSMEINNNKGEINSIFITQENRGEGIGEGLIKSTLNAALRRGVIHVQVPGTGELSGFFEKVGFRSKEDQPAVMAVDLQNYFNGCCQNKSFQG